MSSAVLRTRPSTGNNSDGARCARSSAGSSLTVAPRPQSTARLRVSSRLVKVSVGALVEAGNSAYSMRTPRNGSDTMRVAAALPVQSLSSERW